VLPGRRTPQPVAVLRIAPKRVGTSLLHATTHYTVPTATADSQGDDA